MKTKIFAVLFVLLSTLGMSMIDGFIAPPYLYKSILKVFLFGLIPLLFFLLRKKRNGHLKKLFLPKKKDFLLSLLLGIGVFSVILIAYFALSPHIDLSRIEASLTAGTGITAENFLFVSLYISFINSFVEEFFFRGFAFLFLKKETGRLFAYVYSAAMFALYHVGMTGGWFNPFIYALALLGLFAGGCIFNFLNERSESLYPSWLVHMFANFAINTIGFLLFDIL